LIGLCGGRARERSGLRLDLPSTSTASSAYFRIKFVDAHTRRGIPMVLARSSHYLEQYSDSAGNIAFLEPGMMNRPVWFSILTDGYNFSASDQPASSHAHQALFPYDSGVTLTTTPGTTATVLLNRTQIAERVYRLTGAGLYRDTLLTQDLSEIPASAAPRASEDTHSGSTAQDSLQIAIFKRKVLWLFGDTACAQSSREANCFGSGMFSVGAHSCVPGGAGCADKPDEPPSLQYYGNSTVFPPRPHPMAPIAPLNQNTWVSAFVTIDPGTPSESLFGHYYKNPGDGQGSGSEGIARWDETRSQLVQQAVWPPGLPSGLEGAHTIQLLSPADCTLGYAYFVNGAVSLRVRATAQAVSNPHAYERLSPAASNWSCSTVNWNAHAKKYLCAGSRSVTPSAASAYSACSVLVPMRGLF
jgi:hypothetical protein